jgi:hypothetical protein
MRNSGRLPLAIVALALAAQGCSFSMPVPERYLADNTEGCEVAVEDSRSRSQTVSFGSSELVIEPGLPQVIQREACSRRSLRGKEVTIRITSAFCDTSEWALDAYAEMHARAWLVDETQSIYAMRKSQGTAEGPAADICASLFWPLAEQLVDDIEVDLKLRGQPEDMVSITGAGS